jgi:hypothetical protein
VPHLHRCWYLDETLRGPMFLYLTTTGRNSGQREIEIWFTERGGRFYVIAEHRERANWVRNIPAQPQVSVSAYGNWTPLRVSSTTTASRN